MLSILAFAAASALTAPTVAKADSSEPALCGNGGGVTSADAAAQAELHTLNELPNANLYLGVIRSGKEGCKSTIVRYDIGSAPKKR